MKVLSHPNIVNLVEVIDDPTTDHFYMGTVLFLFYLVANSPYLCCLTSPENYFVSVLEYVEDKWVCEDTGPSCALEENTARKYLRDVVSGLMYLHAHVCFLWLLLAIFIIILIQLLNLYVVQNCSVSLHYVVYAS